MSEEIKSKMKWIGLTGGIGSGKSTVASLLKHKGFFVVDADAMARFVVAIGQPALKQISETFGQDFLKIDGSLDRTKMAHYVFGKPKELLRLEGILHPLIKKETHRRRDDAFRKGQQFGFYDIPLLFEKKLEKEFDEILVVWCTPEQQVERAVKRGKKEKVTAEQILKRMAAQVPLADKIKKANYVIDNSADEAQLANETDRVLREILK